MLVVGLVSGIPVRAQTPAEMSYQGYLEEGGTPVTDGNATLTFRLFDTATGGSPLWSETHSGVDVEGGVFDVTLGAINPLDPLEFYRPLWVEVEVEEQDGTVTTLTPRTPLGASPYTMGLVLPIVQDATVSGTALTINNTGSGDGIKGETQASLGRGVVGRASAFTGENIGVFGMSQSGEGTGVYGLANTTAGRDPNYGIYGQSNSTSGYGVYGINSASSGVAYGVYGETDSPDGTGVYGRGYRGVEGSGFFGLQGESSQPAGRGVYGFNLATEGTTYGVYGAVNSPDGYAGYFDGDVLSTATIEAQEFEGGHTELAASPPGGLLSAVLLVTSNGDGAAIAAQGDVGVSGDLNVTNGTKNFKIDHPLDPARKYLYHFAVESSEVLNVYSGNVTTDAEGYAEVTLPDWFEALNTDFRYQLTVVGQFAEAIIAEKIRNNRFVIRTDAPRVQVSWQVTGVRNDPGFRMRDRPVEEEKPPAARGTYLSPEAYRQAPHRPFP